MSLTAENPKVSVIIPTFNHALFLRETIRSVLAQTYHDFEIIVVDDGSTDDTPQVVAEFGNAVHYIRQENRGLAGARNTGIRAARGEFIGLLDADDIWMPEHLASMLPPFESNREVGAVYCGWQYMDATGNPLPRININVVPPKQAFEKMVRMDFLIPSGVLVRRECFDVLGLFDENMRAAQGSEDWDMWLRLLPKYKMIGLPRALVKYRTYSESMSTNWEGMEQSKRYVIAKHFGPEEEGGPRIRRIAYGGLNLSSALTHFQHREVARGRFFLRRAFLIHPELMDDPDTFYQVCLANQPQGLRGVFQDLDFGPIALKFLDDLNAVFGTAPLPEPLVSRRSDAYGNAYLVLALLAYGCRRMSEARNFLLRALRTQPRFISNRQVISLLPRLCLGGHWIDRVKRFRSRLVSHGSGA